MNATAALSWFARHEIRLAWREWLAMMTGSVMIASARAISSVSIPDASGPNITIGRSPAAIAARNFVAASRGPQTGFSNPRGRAVAASTNVASRSASSSFHSTFAALST